MKEYQIVVWKSKDKEYWYTAQYREVYFLFRGLWRNITPTHQTSYEKAMKQSNFHQLKQKAN